MGAKVCAPSFYAYAMFMLFPAFHIRLKLNGNPIRLAMLLSKDILPQAGRYPSSGWRDKASCRLRSYGGLDTLGNPGECFVLSAEDVVVLLGRKEISIKLPASTAAILVKLRKRQTTLGLKAEALSLCLLLRLQEHFNSGKIAILHFKPASIPGSSNHRSHRKR
jgi:hypothetical protein